MKSLTPNLAVTDVSKSVAFYRDILGFELLMTVPEDKSSFAPIFEPDKTYLFAMLKYENIELMLQQSESLKEDTGAQFEAIGASMTLYIRVDDVDALYAKIAPKCDMIKEIFTTWYGMREFYIRDINGYVLGFAQQVV